MSAATTNTATAIENLRRRIPVTGLEKEEAIRISQAARRHRWMDDFGRPREGIPCVARPGEDGKWEVAP